MPTIAKEQGAGVGEDVEVPEPLRTIDKNVKSCNFCEKHCDRFSKAFQEITRDPGILFLMDIQEDERQPSRGTYTPMAIASIFPVAKGGNNPSIAPRINR